ncbi:MAG: EMC3/TMCO1 family protein [Candidatus Bathyarchaeota archaeon]
MTDNILTLIPYSTFFTIGLALTLALLTSYIQRKFVNLDEVRRVREEMDILRKRLSEARKRGDKKALAKLQRDQVRLMRQSSSVMGQQSKVSLLTMLPFLILFWLLYSFFGNHVVAYSPIPIPYGTIDGTNITFWLWYFFSALALNLPVTRLLRTNLY